MTNDIEQLRRRVGGKALEARLAAQLDPDYAAIMGDRNGQRVKVADDGSVDPASLGAVATELLKSADPKWLLNTSRPVSMAQLRMSLKAERDRERERHSGPSAIERLRAKP
jgi:hypothetical protein